MAGSINKPRKPKSKRGTSRLRANVQKASAAKQRKNRKLAKKNPEWRSKLKKDPGIPNLFPYKEKLLNQIEEDRIRRKEEQQQRRDRARADRKGGMQQVGPEGDEEMKEAIDGMVDDEDEDEDNDNDDDDENMNDGDGELDNSNPMAALIASARKAAEKYDRELQTGNGSDETHDDSASDNDSDAGVMKVPGGASSRKAFDKVFKQVVEQADVILYVLDARDPQGTRSQDVEQSVMTAAGRGKRLVFVLNKVDLIPPPVLRAWLVHLRRFFPTIPLRASNPAPNAQNFHHGDMTLQSSSATLFGALKAYSASRGLKRAISVGVVGYPNVGKSSVINALVSRLGGGGRQHAACPTGAEAGVTTSIRAVKIDNKLTLLDSPGIVFPSSVQHSAGSSVIPKNLTEAHAHLVLLNAVPPKQIDDPVPAVTLLLKRFARTPDLMDKLQAVYDLPPLLMDSRSGDVTSDLLVQVARKRGRLGRGGVPNIHSAAMTVVTDWRDGRIQGWTDAPVSITSEAGAAEMVGGHAVMPDQKVIVTEWAKEFKLEGLWGDEDGTDGTGTRADVEMQQG